MFYPELIEYLRSVTAITDTVETYDGSPSIFSNEAPEEAEKPYVVVSISGKKTPDSTIIFGDIMIDYYDFDKSRVVSDAFDTELENALDSMKMQSERLSDIRLDLSSSGHVEDSDPRNIHFNAIYSFRGIRCKWMQDTQ